MRYYALSFARLILYNPDWMTLLTKSGFMLFVKQSVLESLCLPGRRTTPVVPKHRLSPSTELDL